VIVSDICYLFVGLTDTPTVPTAHSLVESAALQSAAKQNHVELKEVEVVTGEEGESNVFQVIAANEDVDLLNYYIY